MNITNILFLIILSFLTATVNCEQRVVCYWPEWHVNEKAPYKSVPEDIDATLCTHIHFAFALLDDTNETLKDSEGSPQTDLYKRLIALKQKNSNLKVIMSLGGWGDNSAKYSKLVANADKRKLFSNHSISYIQKYGFDGLDIDWEFPVCWAAECSGGHDADKANFATWIHV
jgi:chitinase